MTITEPSSAFTAYVSDANSGIDASTAQIYVDGKPVTTNVAGNMMYCGAVSFGAGTHKIKFEVADNLGNYTTLTRTLVSTTVDSSVAQRVRIELDGHNDSDAAPMPGSVYYIDVVKTAGAALTSAEFTLSLNTANTWVADEMTVADGYHLTYTANPTYPNQITFTCTATGSTSARETIATIPVRLYNPLLTNGVSDGAPVTVSGRLIVAPLTVEAEATIDGTYGNYYAFNVADIAGQRTIVRHEHTASDIADVAATCTTDGYTGRTYCDECESVADWGTKIPATGHSYEFVNTQFVCDVCDDVYEPGTGLFEMNGHTYYAINNNILNGWQQIGDDWYYFRSSTYQAAEGVVNFNFGDIPITFEFDNGRMLEGKWVETATGTRYYNGPAPYAHSWAEIDGKTYYFDEDANLIRGYYVIKDSRYSHDDDYSVYRFNAETGVLEEKLTSSGLLDTPDGKFYLVDGYAKHGLFRVGNDYYYFNTSRKAVTGHYYVSELNGLNFQNAYYDFDEDCKLIMSYDRVAPTAATVNAAGNNEYYIGLDGNYYEKINDNYTEHTLDYFVIPKISVTRHAAVAATYTSTGNTEYYAGEDGKFYVKDGNTYVEIAEESWIVSSLTAEEAADVDGDGVLNAEDLVVCTQALLSAESDVDVNGDGSTNILDLIFVKKVLLQMV